MRYHVDAPESDDDRLIDRFTESREDRAARIAALIVPEDRAAVLRRALEMEG